MPSRNDTEDVTEMEEDQVAVPGKLSDPLPRAEKLILDGASNGQLPVWASNQLQQALDQLFRTNLIK